MAVVPHLSISLTVTFIPSGKDCRMNLQMYLNVSSFASSFWKLKVLLTPYMQLWKRNWSSTSSRVLFSLKSKNSNRTKASGEERVSLHLILSSSRELEKITRAQKNSMTSMRPTQNSNMTNPFLPLLSLSHITKTASSYVKICSNSFLLSAKDSLSIWNPLCKVRILPIGTLIYH